jgi:LuxR family maltose regulon positive regulatory protein
VLRLAGEIGAVATADTAMLRPLVDAQRLALRGRVAWHRGEWDRAREAFRAVLAHEVALRVFGEDADVRVRLAQLCLRAGDVDGAAAALAPVFEAAERYGAPGAALACPRTSLEALAGAPWNGRLAPERIASLRGGAACLGVAGAPPSKGLGAEAEARPASVLGGAETLSPRELEVLQLIAAGESNKLIARAFDLSPHTVKRHVANILDKLGVQSRGQAAAWYSERRGR